MTMGEGGVPSALGWAVEEACINGFPALRTALVDGWLVRLSGSTRRTANSATPLPQAHGAVAALVADCEAFYRRHGRQAIFRLPSYLDPAYDHYLAARGYGAEGHSCVIHGPIAPVAEAADAIGGSAGVRLLPQPTAEWFAAMARLQGQTPEQHQVYQRILGGLVVPAAFAAATRDGDIVAMAFAVLHRGLVCYESVVTDAAQRRQGHARRVLAALAGWARDNGAAGACLQVEADNMPGRALYDALGMTSELHRYHYRRQPG